LLVLVVLAYVIERIDKSDYEGWIENSAHEYERKKILAMTRNLKARGVYNSVAVIKRYL